MPAGSETVEEVNFWKELDAEAAHIDEQLRSDEANVSMAVLKQAKRYWATMAFESDTVGLKRAAELAQAYAPLTSALPLAPLRQAPSVDALRAAVRDVFAHLQRAGAASSYPIERHLRLIEALARDVASRLTALLAARPLLALGADEADNVAAQVRCCSTAVCGARQQRHSLRNSVRRSSPSGASTLPSFTRCCGDWPSAADSTSCRFTSLWTTSRSRSVLLPCAAFGGSTSNCAP